MYEYVAEGHGDYALCLRKDRENEYMAMEALFLSPEVEDAGRFIGKANMHIFDSSQGTYVYDCALACSEDTMDVVKTGMGNCKERARFFLVLESLHIDALFDHTARRTSFIHSIGSILSRVRLPYLFLFKADPVCGPSLWCPQSGMMRQFEAFGYEFFRWDDDNDVFVRKAFVSF